MLYKTKICIVERNELLRTSYHMIIDGLQAYEVVGAFASYDELAPHLIKLNPKVLIMDVDQGGDTGIECISEIKRKLPEAEVLVFTELKDRELIMDSFRAGAGGYILKNAKSIEILEALEDMRQGGAPMSLEVSKILVGFLRKNMYSPLSNRERQVLELFSEGKTYSEVAFDLYISKETTKSHLKNIYSKLKVHSKSDALRVAKENRWI